MDTERAPSPGQSGSEPPPSDRGAGPPIWTTYRDPSSGFAVDYPDDFVAEPQDVARFAQFSPAPSASIFFMNPTMARGVLAGVEPPDLDVRVYDVGAVDSLRNWLAAVGRASPESGARIEPYQNANVSGVQVCQATLLSPACAVYVLSGTYQLTTLSLAGEAMQATFTLLRSNAAADSGPRA